MDHLVKFTLYVHNDRLGYAVVFSLCEVGIVGSVISSGQKHCLQPADIGSQIRRYLDREVKHLCAIDIINSGTVIPCSIRSIHGPERCHEAGSFVRLHGDLIAGSVLDEIYTLDLYGYTAVSVLGKAHIGQLCQFIEDLISRIPQVIGMLNTAALNGTDLII